ncbi:hypothetical protein H3S90_08045 [Bartonella sp. W8097]|uniref:hypothetical protein n=1 Tax=Bartonella apihabitans TaxID=2750929 RepID=UPI001436F487|nr:hypothetical protein [Bartonella apihabitans]MBI0021035.1 hypothetical protein [Bartonella apihabitans]QHJ78449.1 MAG: hypothetical protein [Bacteriophage sp.]
MNQDETEIQVPPMVVAAEAMAEAEFWRKQSLKNAYLRFQAEQELAALKAQKTAKKEGE